jgi:hypothetical protein
MGSLNKMTNEELNKEESELLKQLLDSGLDETTIRELMENPENAEDYLSMGQHAVEQQVKDSFYKFLRDLKNTKDSTKIANLTSEELGKSDLSLRGAKKLALLSDTLGLPELGDCYRQEAEIMASTSMSRYVKGANFLSLIFTQIRKSVSGVETQDQPKKSGWFNKSGG